MAAHSTKPKNSTAIPLSRWADRQLRLLADETNSPAIAYLDGATLQGERARLNGFSIPARRSAGGKCHLIAAQDGWIALNLSRDDDRELLPALFGARMFDTADLGEIAEHIYACNAQALVARGREMGLAVAAINEPSAGEAITRLERSQPSPPPSRAPLVVDLSALWAGPLCAHLLQLAGAQVVKVESLTRRDALREGDPALFALLNGGKDSVSVDLADNAFRALIAKADIVIEAARPRALAQLGVDACALVAAKPGKVWIIITGHGASGEAANWIGFGDDCGVAGGLSAALQQASGAVGFVGDAIADPLTGIAAARAAWQAWSSGKGGRISLSMSGVAARALAEERAFDAELLHAELVAWAAASGRSFPQVAERSPHAPVHLLGADNARWLSC